MCDIFFSHSWIESSMTLRGTHTIEIVHVYEWIHKKVNKGLGHLKAVYPGSNEIVKQNAKYLEIIHLPRTTDIALQMCKTP